jgi:nanoRNase/pAp phosphatase (c-di-AMP/oligoRNAs hydrolase)
MDHYEMDAATHLRLSLQKCVGSGDASVSENKALFIALYFLVKLHQQKRDHFIQIQQVVLCDAQFLSLDDICEHEHHIEPRNVSFNPLKTLFP